MNIRYQRPWAAWKSSSADKHIMWTWTLCERVDKQLREGEMKTWEKTYITKTAT